MSPDERPEQRDQYDRLDQPDRFEVESLVRPLLTRSAELGFIGPGPIQDHIDHALRLTDAVRDFVAEPIDILDLGSGGGLPGLVIAASLPSHPVALLDAQHRRCEFLRSATEELRPDGSLTVIEGRAEVLARAPQHSDRFGLVVARSFGPPGSVAECAARFLVIDGILAVSEPPVADAQRWPAEKVRSLGLAIVERRDAPLPVMILKKVSATPDRYPRREGVPTRQPLW